MAKDNFEERNLIWELGKNIWWIELKHYDFELERNTNENRKMGQNIITEQNSKIENKNEKQQVIDVEEKVEQKRIQGKIVRGF